MATKKPANNASADDITLKLIDEVKKRKAEINKTEKSKWLTNRTFSYIEGSMSNAINLAAENNVKILISIASFLRSAERDYKQTVIDLGVENAPEFSWQGFSVSDWLEDLKLKVNKIQLESKKKKLEEYEARLNAVMTPELKRQMELEKIASELG